MSPNALGEREAAACGRKRRAITSNTDLTLSEPVRRSCLQCRIRIRRLRTSSNYCSPGAVNTVPRAQKWPERSPLRFGPGPCVGTTDEARGVRRITWQSDQIAKNCLRTAPSSAATRHARTERARRRGDVVLHNPEPLAQGEAGDAALARVC